MEAYLLDWANLLLRWLHVISGVAWIGASFYFVMLDNSLTQPVKRSDSDKGVSGELWAVHGGGFYHSQKYKVGPKGEPLSDNLHWSKWEAYTTWFSGMALLVIIYWFGANTYLIDQQVMPMSATMAITISGSVLVAGWLIYNTLCRVLANKDTLLTAIILLLIIATDWALFQAFSARAAYLHVGAMMGTIMVFNVMIHIIPGQKKVVAQIRAGEEPDSAPGIIGKQRSVHNTYFTLPVLFIMISGHYPITYGNEHGWLVLAFVMMAGVLIRQFFVLRHRGLVLWWLPVIGIIILLALIWVLRPSTEGIDNTASVAIVSDAQVTQVIAARCTVCHAVSPTQAGFSAPPLGLVLESSEQIALNAEKIATSVQSHYMPLGNLTGMTNEERLIISTWYRQRSTIKQPL
jgi:uncharacterized membrane protein|tara:strand:+ start:1276 stop:2487 length:1212 start_codon:yes stop_codon:yes gene_type:complete